MVKVSILRSFDTVSESCGLVNPSWPAHILCHWLLLCSSRWEIWYSGALCISVTPLPLHFPNVNNSKSLCALFGWVYATACPRWHRDVFWGPASRAGACIRAFCTCGIECLGQARGLHCYSAGPMLHTPLEASLRVMVWKGPFRLVRK